VLFEQARNLLIGLDLAFPDSRHGIAAKFRQRFQKDRDVRELFPEGIPQPARAEAAPTRQRPSLRIVVNNEFAGGCTP
jgi:hypothetical protein